MPSDEKLAADDLSDDESVAGTFDDGHAGTPLPSSVFDFVGNAIIQS